MEMCACATTPCDPYRCSQAEVLQVYFLPKTSKALIPALHGLHHQKSGQIGNPELAATFQIFYLLRRAGNKPCQTHRRGMRTTPEL